MWCVILFVFAIRQTEWIILEFFLCSFIVLFKDFHKNRFRTQLHSVQAELDKMKNGRKKRTKCNQLTSHDFVLIHFYFSFALVARDCGSPLDAQLLM